MFIMWSQWYDLYLKTSKYFIVQGSGFRIELEALICCSSQIHPYDLSCTFPYLFFLHKKHTFHFIQTMTFFLYLLYLEFATLPLIMFSYSENISIINTLGQSKVASFWFEYWCRMAPRWPGSLYCGNHSQCLVKSQILGFLRKSVSCVLGREAPRKFFSRENDSTIANVCPFVLLS